MNFDYIYTDIKKMSENLIDRLPIACCRFDTAGTLISCNNELAHLFGFDSKEDILLRFDEILPEYQPGGILTRELLKQKIQKARSEGFARLELHCDLIKNGALLELTLRHEVSEWVIGCAVNIGRYKNYDTVTVEHQSRARVNEHLNKLLEKEKQTYERFDAQLKAMGLNSGVSALGSFYRTDTTRSLHN